MTIILLGSDKKAIKRTELSKTLVRLLYAVHDLDATLVRFNTMYSDEAKGTADIMLEFDAHVGDCGCHLRAQMLWSITQHYGEAKSREWIGNTIQILMDIKKKIIAMYSNIHQIHRNSGLLDFPSSISLTDLLDRVGCEPLFTILDQHSSKIDADDKFALSTASDHASTSYTDSKGGKAYDDHPTTCYSHQIPNADKWNLSNYRMVARFLSYCRRLSLGKTVSLESGATRLRSRLDPLFAFSEAEKQLDWLELIGNTQLLEFITDDDRPSRRTLVQDIEKMQIYITQLTCNWMSRLSHEMGLGHPIQKLLESSVRMSPRELHCIPAYSSILVIRFEWLVKGTPLLLLVRRFCAQGYHNTFYRVSANPDAVHLIIEAVGQDNSKIVDFGNADWFYLTSVSLNSILTEDWARRPHVVLISNSIAGSMADCYIRMGNDSKSSPHNESCPEHDEFVKNEFAAINFSQAIMYFFGAHDQYPFDLPANEVEHDVIEKIVDSTLGREAATTYRRTLDETYEYGAGCTALGLLNFQHVFAELPVAVARQTEQIILRNERPAAYGYPWADATDCITTPNGSAE